MSSVAATRHRRRPHRRRHSATDTSAKAALRGILSARGDMRRVKGLTPLPRLIQLWTATGEGERAMRCFELHGTTGLDGLKLAERGLPQAGTAPGGGQGQGGVVQLPRHDDRRRRLWRRPRQMPLIPLSDGAGEVAAVGAGVTGVKIGDRVCGTFFQRWIAGPVRPDIQEAALGGTADGMLTEYALLEGEGVVRVPRSSLLRRGGDLALRRAHRLAWAGRGRRDQARRRRAAARHRRRVDLRPAIRAPGRGARHRAVVERREARARAADGRERAPSITARSRNGRTACAKPPAGAASITCSK